MLEYLIKSGLCLFILYSFYRLFLENEQFHYFKRFYLLGILAISFLLPLITLTYTVEVQQSAGVVQETIINANPGNTLTENGFLNSYWALIASGIYLTGFFIFLIRFLSNLLALLKEVKSNVSLKSFKYIFVLINKIQSPYSFLNYIFLNKEKFENKKISSAILEHEKVHVDQKHSLDLLFIEFLQVVFWFNPIFHWIKSSVKLNHEFLADNAVIAKDINALEYSNILYYYSSGHYHNSLSSPMSQSLIKKRIIMITKSFSMQKLLTRLGLLIPVLALCIYFFNNEIVASPVLVTDNSAMFSNKNIIQDSDLISIKIEESSLYVNGKKVPVKNFKDHLDDLLADKSDEAIADMGFKMKMINPDKGFIEKVNKEFSKTRMAKITGHSILPPPPPAPPKAGEAPVAPEAPKLNKEKYIEIETVEKVGEKDVVTKRIIKYSGDNPPPPPPPNPIEEIEKIKNEGGSFYYNDKEISAEQAKELVTSKKELNIDITKTEGVVKVKIVD